MSAPLCIFGSPSYPAGRHHCWYIRCFLQYL